MRKTPLYDAHVALGAKMVDFTGWLMPLQFRGILEEHHHTRGHVSLFDCSHMPEFRVRGSGNLKRYDRLVTAEIMGLKVGRGRYGAIVNERGGIVDDVITIRLAEEEYLVVSNAGPAERLRALLSDCAEDISSTVAKIDVQGPASRRLLSEMGLTVVESLRYFGVVRTSWMGCELLVTRMGYTGELGFELYVPWEKAELYWRRLLECEEVRPAGLGARDTLRLEMGYPLSGQDFDETRSPLEACQDMFVAWNKEFIGKPSLLAQREGGEYPLLRGLLSADRRSPRHGQELFADGQCVGVVTSGTFGPSVCRGIGLGYLDREYGEVGTQLRVGPKRLPVEVVSLPFYKDGTCRR